MFEEKATTFLRSQTHMVLAVVTAEGKPWAVPVKIQRQDGLRFEWDSSGTTVHSRAIESNPQLTLCFFQKSDDAKEEMVVYGHAVAEILATKENGITRYQATLQDAWINGRDHIKRELDLTKMESSHA